MEKFRIWVERKEVLIPFEHILQVTYIPSREVHVGELYEDTGEHIWGATFKFDQIEFMYCSGIKDLNGEDMYVGDIVRVGSRLGGETEELIGQVLYGRGRYYVYVNTISIYELGSKLVTFEVIGNIHKNKELLKGTK